MNVLTRVRASARDGPLADRNFRLLSAGQLTSTVGDYCYAVALPWLVLSAHGSPVLLGAVLACYGLPRTLLIPLGGVVTDKLTPQAIMLATDAARAVMVMIFALFAFAHVASLAALGPVAALLGAGEGLFMPASFAIMPALVAPGRLQNANAINSAIVQTGSFLGPALGGVLVATAGPAPAFIIDAASFAISAGTLASIRHSARNDARIPEPARSESGAAKSRGIWALVRGAQPLQVLLAVNIVANFAFGGAFEVALPTLAHLRFGAAGYGTLIACLGLGAVTGTLAAARTRAARRPAVVAGESYLLLSVSLGLIPFLGGLAGAAAATFALGVCNGFGNVTMITLLQRWAPSDLLGRVMSLVMLTSVGTLPVSAAVSGILVRSLSPVAFFPIAGSILGIAVLGALSQKVFRGFGRDRSPPDGTQMSHESQAVS